MTTSFSLYRHDSSRARNPVVERSARLGSPFSLEFDFNTSSNVKSNVVCIDESCDPLTPTTPSCSSPLFDVKIINCEGGLQADDTITTVAPTSVSKTMHIDANALSSSTLSIPAGQTIHDASAQDCGLDDVELTPAQLAILFEPLDRRPSGFAHIGSLRPT